MIEMRSKQSLKGAEKYSDCNSCGKRSSETELYQILLHYENSNKHHEVNLCRDCLYKLSEIINRDLKENKAQN